ncbi:MAG: hypothetical protein GY847_34515 [Proteobacteria bacterium]|nr:hypothetical protein [Pseudomonadota bacterium]
MAKKKTVKKTPVKKIKTEVAPEKPPTEEAGQAEDNDAGDLYAEFKRKLDEGFRRASATAGIGREKPVGTVEAGDPQMPRHRQRQDQQCHPHFGMHHPPVMAIPMPPFHHPDNGQGKHGHGKHGPASDPKCTGSRTGLFDSIGRMIRSSVDLVNASLDGGAQLINGIVDGNHSAPHHSGIHGQGNHGHGCGCETGHGDDHGHGHHRKHCDCHGYPDIYNQHGNYTSGQCCGCHGVGNCC